MACQRIAWSACGKLFHSAQLRRGAAPRLKAPMADERRPDGQSCKDCEFFIDHETPDDDPNEPNGYCSNPTGHEEYGGHWTHKDSWCSLFAVTADRRPWTDRGE